jgi:hypothetical protein
VVAEEWRFKALRIDGVPAFVVNGGYSASATIAENNGRRITDGWAFQESRI